MKPPRHPEAVLPWLENGEVNAYRGVRVVLTVALVMVFGVIVAANLANRRSSALGDD